MLGVRCLVVGAWCLVLWVWCLVFDVWCLVLGAWKGLIRGLGSVFGFLSLGCRDRVRVRHGFATERGEPLP